MWFSKSVYRQILCCAIVKASGQHLFYSVVLVGREEYLLWILTRETLYLQIVNHVTFEIFYGQK